MANVIPFSISVETSENSEQKLKMWQRFSWARILGRDDSTACPKPQQELQQEKIGISRRLSRKVVPGLPRPGTFKRQNSERREKLKPVEPSINERRAVSADRKRALSASPAPQLRMDLPRLSVPEVRRIVDGSSAEASHTVEGSYNRGSPLSSPPLPPQETVVDEGEPDPSEVSPEDEIDEQIRDELERKWILNLSMHFRDQSPREKFFITYAETPRQWRRVTVSCDYRDAPPESLERDLQNLEYQRDKSARIYESIRSSLSEIQFYDTVTNLKLETRDDRLHVHVTEDVYEIIPYPSVNAVRHLHCRQYKESELDFEAHMSGFVYKVSAGEQVWIKKEIPEPDSVDEFLYEVNALNELIGSNNVILFQGLVVDESCSVVKGLLIGFAEEGALVDILYDHKGHLPWLRRERWAKQIVNGLAEIHEAGFVQGDFTLSNIVIDEHDEAKIIDINRRGCPVGWEPPEISKLIESGQRISMYIGVKSDLFQLGMVLWALAEEVDEPERQRPLSLLSPNGHIPLYFRTLVEQCLSPTPKDRPAAKDLLSKFPPLDTDSPTPVTDRPAEPLQTNGDSANFNMSSSPGRQSLHTGHTCDSLHESIGIQFDGPGSYAVTRRGRQPPTNLSHISGSGTSLNNLVDGYGDPDFEPQIVPISPTGEHRWDEVEMNGIHYLVQRGSLDLENPTTETGAPVADLRREFAHVDSGLADMELAGVGGHNTLKLEGKPEIGKSKLSAGLQHADDQKMDL